MKNKTLVENKIKELVPDIFIEGCEAPEGCTDCWWHKNYPPDGNKYRPITLEDVLRALEKSVYLDSDMGTPDTYWTWAGELLKKWKMGKPLSEQSPETIDFLWSILK